MAATIVPGVTATTFPTALVNAYVVDADVPTLVDTGTPGGIGRLQRLVEQAGFALDDVRRILVTHRHSDHAGNAAQLARRTGAEVHVPPGDAAWLTERREQPRPKAATPLGHLMVPYVKLVLPWRVEPVHAEPSLVDGARFGPLRVVATPGHTVGHVSILDTRRGVLFTADAAANMTGVGPHPAADDPDRARESFRRLATLEFDVACFGHGRAVRSGARARFR